MITSIYKTVYLFQFFGFTDSIILRHHTRPGLERGSVFRIIGVASIQDMKICALDEIINVYVPLRYPGTGILQQSKPNSVGNRFDDFTVEQ